MTLATLAEVLQPALKGGYAVAGLVVLGWEDARAFLAAAEAENAPIILQAGPGCRAHMPLPVLAAMFRTLAEGSGVPIVAHLDHGYELDECRRAIECGFTSVMFDGSRKPIDQNIAETARVAELAHAAGVSVEGEIGLVGYDQGAASARTHPDAAARFEKETGIDALAISVGNVHLQQKQVAQIDIAALAAIEAVTKSPLVIHGGSGIAGDARSRLARSTKICKFNIGTELRMVFGQALRAAVNADAHRFDRLAILKETEAPVCEAVRGIIRELRTPIRGA